LRLGIRGKLFLLLIVAVVAVELAAGFYLERELRVTMESRIESELVTRAETTRDLFEITTFDWETETVDDVADRIGKSGPTRITVIADDGKVVADSELDLAELMRVDNHADRPEVVQANAEGFGLSSRYSQTLDTQMLYAAVPFDRGDVRGVIRVATPLSEVDAVIRRLRLILGLGGLLALAIAVFTGGLLSHFVSRTLRALIDAAHAMADSTGTRQRLPVSSKDEIGGLAGSFNRMAEDLEKTVAALADERNRFETVLESMDEAVLALDENEQITTVNRAARELLGLTSDVRSKRLIEAIRIPELGDLVKRATKTGTATIEFDLLDRGRRRVLARATPQSDEGIVLVMHDVTEIRRLETVRRDFVANVSHELRTPVSVIRANTETLLDGALDRPDQAKRFLEATLRHADRLGRLVADLLDISRIEAGKYQIDAHRVKLAPIVQRVFEAVEGKAEKKDMTLSLEVGDDIEAMVEPKAMEQVLVNLVENAVKYTPEGGHIEVVAIPKEDSLRLEVRDDGPGIEPAHRARIFERFYRIDPGRSRDMGGTGLGLSIVRHLVEAMHGTVGVEGRAPRGSVFWMVFPNPPA
jgi:two-component system phosphate regulon sensor histidine kinase PhoR